MAVSTSRATLHDVLSEAEQDREDDEWLKRKHTEDHINHLSAHPLCQRCQDDREFFHDQEHQELLNNIRMRYDHLQDQWLETYRRLDDETWQQEVTDDADFPAPSASE